MCSFVWHKVEGQNERVFFSARNKRLSSTKGMEQICYSAAILAEFSKPPAGTETNYQVWYHYLSKRTTQQIKGERQWNLALSHYVLGYHAFGWYI